MPDRNCVPGRRMSRDHFDVSARTRDSSARPARSFRSTPHGLPAPAKSPIIIAVPSRERSARFCCTNVRSAPARSILRTPTSPGDKAPDRGDAPTASSSMIASMGTSAHRKPVRPIPLLSRAARPGRCSDRQRGHVVRRDGGSSRSLVPLSLSLSLSPKAFAGPFVGEHVLVEARFERPARFEICWIFPIVQRSAPIARNAAGSHFRGAQRRRECLEHGRLWSALEQVLGLTSRARKRFASRSADRDGHAKQILREPSRAFGDLLTAWGRQARPP
jgi:hypothetical protein